MVTEFTDHICVTMDAELIMFLHDLVSAYLKEKEKGVLHIFDFSFYFLPCKVYREGRDQWINMGNVFMV